MPWEIRRDLHLDINAAYGAVLLTSATDSSLKNPPPDLVAGDKMPVRLYFWERGANGTLTAADPGATSTFVFSGRPNNVPPGTDLLFLSNSFTEVSAGVWEGSLDLHTAEIAAHLAASPTGSKTITGEVEVRDATGNIKRLSLQFPLTARPQAYDNQDAPTALPTPDEDWLAHGHPQSLSAGQKAQALTNLGLPSLNNWAGGRAPLVTDDTASGYEVGSLWLDDSATPKEAYRAFSVAAGAADWQLTTLTPDELGTAAFAATGDFDPAGAAATAQAAAQTYADGLTPASIGAAVDDEVLHLAGTETASGLKKFTLGIWSGVVRALTGGHVDIQNASGTSLLRVGVGGGTGVAEGLDSTASGDYSHAEGLDSTASGESSHAEGSSTTASGDYSHAEGTDSTASGGSSHAEGTESTASGYASHAEGASTTASGESSHAEGSSTTASGDYSHAGGLRAKAIHDGARVISDSQNADVSSTTTDQFTARFQNGYEFKGGAANFEGTLTVGAGSWTGATFTGAQAFTGAVSTQAITEGVVAIGTVVSAHTLAITSGTVLTATLTASTACTFTMPPATAGKFFTLYLKQAAATGNGTATFTGVKFSGDTAPTITATAGRMDIISFVADGSTWYASVLPNITP